MDQGEAHLSKLARRSTLPLGCLLLLPAGLPTPEVVGLLTSSVFPINVPSCGPSSRPKCPQKGALLGAANGLGFIVRRSRPDLPGGQSASGSPGVSRHECPGG